MSDAELAEYVFLRQAEIARQKKKWGEVFKTFKLALESDPNKASFLMGLAHAYESKGREENSHTHLAAAIKEYKKIIALYPENTQAHDALIATAVKTNQIEMLLIEYKELVAKNPQVQSYISALRKIQALLILHTESTSAVDVYRSKGWKILDWGLPFLALVFLGAAVYLMLQKTSGGFQSQFLGKTMLKAAGSVGVVYLGYIAYKLRATSRIK